MQTFKSKNLDIFFAVWFSFILANVLFLQTFNSLGNTALLCKEITWCVVSIMWRLYNVYVYE